MEKMTAESMTKIIINYVNLALLKRIGNNCNADLKQAAMIASSEIEANLVAHFADDRYLHFMESMQFSEDASDACYECATQGYTEGYFDAAADMLNLIAKYIGKEDNNHENE